MLSSLSHKGCRAICRALLLLIAVPVVSVQTALQSRAADKPNVIFILADDLGWGDLGCYGHTQLRTPNLDKLASDGTLFTQFYVNASVCSPSRCAFFTGQYPSRHKIHGHFGKPELNASRGMSQFLEPQVPNIAKLLKSAGYKTGHIGKWHLGNNSGGPDPDAYGFDFVGLSETDGADGPVADPYFRAKSSKVIVDEALQFIQSNKDTPFYLQLWTLVPHATLNPTPEQMKPYANRRAGGPDFPHASAAEIFYSSVTDLDKHIGRLVAGLDRMGLSENTLILFSSDNGPEDIHIGNAGHSGIGNAGPFRGRKRSLYEGGIRVPGIVKWPGKVPAGKVDTTSIVSGVDWMPTVCELAGVTIPEKHALDGESMADVLKGASRARKRPLFWEWRFRIFGEPFHHSPELAVRDGDWKLYVNPDGSRTELYDMRSDLTQLNNVAEHHPEIVAKMRDEVVAWSKTLPEGPRDPGAGQMNLPGPKLPEASGK